MVRMEQGTKLTCCQSEELVEDIPKPLLCLPNLDRTV